MDSISYVMTMWSYGAAVIVGVLILVALWYYLAKSWSSPDSVSFTTILAVGLAAVATIFFNIQGAPPFGLTRHQVLFILLYAWCATGLMFFVKQVHPIKLLIGILLQAVILYMLYRMT